MRADEAEEAELDYGDPSAIDPRRLREGASMRSSGAKGRTPTNTDAPTAAQSANSAQARRRAMDECEAKGKRAREDLKTQEALFEKGVSTVSQMEASVGYVTWRDRNGSLHTEKRHTPASRVGGGQISCSTALKDPSMYAAEAKKCRQIQSRIAAAKRKIQAVGLCMDEARKRD